jgi:hypothetical protein
MLSGCFGTLGLCHLSLYIIANARITGLQNYCTGILVSCGLLKNGALGVDIRTFPGEFVSSLSGGELIVGFKP